MRIGIDVGGTFTDAVIVDGRNVWRGKATTTPGKWTTGILNALAVACKAAGRDVRSTLADTDVLAHGSTIVTNALTEGLGVRTALFVTAGFRDVLAIARSARRSTLDLQRQVPPAELVRPQDIVEVTERIGAGGDVVYPLAAVDAVNRAGALDNDVKAIAVALLFSYKNPAHERELADELRRRFPDKPVILSSDVHPLMREYERTVTTVLSAAIAPIVGNYLEDLQRQLTAAGLAAPILVMQSDGILVTVEQARRTPLSLYQSGPAGGVVAAQWAAAALEIPKAVCCDMGGTSFDISLLFETNALARSTTTLAGHRAGLRTLDIRSIGAGGGSRLRTAHGLPSVGPDSAGSVPGPACYGQGGVDPTITDVLVCLGLIPSGTFLGGSRTLDEEAAASALLPLAKELQIQKRQAQGSSDAQAVAAEFLHLAIEEMAHAIRTTAADSGHDPAEFSMIAYGGAVGLVAAQIAEILGIREVVVPVDCGVFSAFGLAIAKPAYVRVAGTSWRIAKDPWDDLTDVFSALREQLAHTRDADDRDPLRVQWELDIRLRGQVEHLTIPTEWPERQEHWRDELLAAYRSTYETVHGPGSFWHQGEAAAQVIAVRGIADLAEDGSQARQVDYRRASAASGEQAPTDSMERLVPVWWPAYEQIILTSGGSAKLAGEGPLSMTMGDSTLYVPRHWRVQAEDQDLLRLTRSSDG